MMEEKYLDKKIVFEDGKLYCNGQEISIEEAEEIIKKQVTELEKSQEKMLQEVNDLDEDRTRAISNKLNEVFVYSSNSGIYVRGNNEYYEAADLLLQADLLCNKSLRLFSAEHRKEKKRKKQEEDPLKKLLDKFDWEGTEPDSLEIIEKAMEMYLASTFVTEMKKQFYNIDFNFQQEDIRIYVKLPFEIKIYIVRDDFTLSFQINQNIPKIYNIPFNFIISSMKINGFEIQNTFYDLSSDKNNNIKFAQTVENAIFKEIRFLKNLIKEEIDYSLAMNISKAKERFDLTNKILEKYNGLLNEELLEKVNEIIEETKNYEINIEENETDEFIEEVIDINSIIYDNLSKTFNIDKEKIIKDLNQTNNQYEIIILGQKVTIYNDNENIKVKSINTLGNNKNDLVNENIKGKNIHDKIRKAVNYSYLPIIYRNIDNILKNNKLLEHRKKIKEIEDKFKDLILFIYEEFDTYENIDFLQEKINDILDIINVIGKNINIEVFNILDFILFKSLETLYIKDIDIINFRNKISLSYNNFYSLNNDFFETIIEVKSLIKRILNIAVLSKEINIYLDNIFDTSIENSIIELTDILAEDYVCGKICRNLLSLLDISDTLKDDSFKFQIRNIMLEFISIIS